MIFLSDKAVRKELAQGDHRDLVRIYQLCVARGYFVDLEACVYLWHAWSERSGVEWLPLPADDEDLWVCVLTSAQILAFDTPGFELGDEQESG